MYKQYNVCCYHLSRQLVRFPPSPQIYFRYLRNRCINRRFIDCELVVINMLIDVICRRNKLNIAIAHILFGFQSVSVIRNLIHLKPHRGPIANVYKML